jgi:hypothetical protein
MPSPGGLHKFPAEGPGTIPIAIGKAPNKKIKRVGIGSSCLNILIFNFFVPPIGGIGS